MDNTIYKIELHVHSAESSGCAVLSAEDQVRLYKERGYSGMVFTDHFRGNDCYTVTEEGFDTSRWMKGYLCACEAGRRYGMKIYFGLELGLNYGPEDYLIYGAMPSFLTKHADITKMTLQEVKAVADQNGLLLIQAHPFRQGLKQASGEEVHGYEVYNGANGNSRNRNDLTLTLWREQGGIPTSGSDCHYLEQLGTGGIETDILPENEAALAALLRNGQYRLITDSEFQSWLKKKTNL